MKPSPSRSLNQNICSVKPLQLSLNLGAEVLPLTKGKGVIHHKVLVSYSSINKGKPYGVSSSHKILTKGLLLKKWDLVVRCLKEICELTPAERDVALELLRLQAYYPQVYPKAIQVASEVNRGVATFWRTAGKLRDMNLLGVVNRFVMREKAQISNLYTFDKLLIVLARYLAEHGHQFYEKWLKPYLSMPGSQFWGSFWDSFRPRSCGPPLDPG